MRIGLTGVPGSGKTALAESLKSALLEKGLNMGPVEVIDGYVEKLQDDIDLALSFHATYIGNLHVALYRESLERLALKNNNVVITSGTLFETSSYAAQRLQEDYEFLSSADGAREDILLRIEAITRIFACMYMDTFRYDHVFYLPPVSNIEDLRIKDLDKNLQAAVNAFQLFPTTKLYVQGSDMLEVTEKRLNIVLEEIINANKPEGQKVQPQEPDGSGA